MLGRYTLLKNIGKGGCGGVYLPELNEPVRRRVALKVSTLGMDTRQVITRFAGERAALALMDHPGIATAVDPHAWARFALSIRVYSCPAVVEFHGSRLARLG